jgi:hypothetical protein
MNKLKSKVSIIAYWLVIILAGVILIKKCNTSLDETQWNRQVAKHKVDSVEVVRSNSVYPIEPRYKLYLSNGQTVTVANKQYAYNTDSIEFITYRKIN